MTSPHIHGQRVELPASGAEIVGQAFPRKRRRKLGYRGLPSFPRKTIDITSSTIAFIGSGTGLSTMDSTRCFDQSLSDFGMLFDDAFDLVRRKAVDNAASRTGEFKSFQVHASNRHFKVLAAIASYGDADFVRVGHRLQIQRMLAVPDTVGAELETASFSRKGGEQ